MAFTIDVDTSILGTPPKRGRQAKPKPPPEPVFSTAKAKTIAGIKGSITEAGQRFLGEGGGPLPEPVGEIEKGKTYYASYSWRVDTRNKENPGKEETAKVSLKAGVSKLSIFPKMTTKDGEWVAVEGETSDYLSMPGENVKSYLEHSLLPAVEAMEKDDGGLGSLFHATILERATKANTKKKYNPETDCFE